MIYACHDVGSDRAVTRFYRQIAQIERLLVASFEREEHWRPAAAGERMTAVRVIAAVMLTAAAVLTIPAARRAEHTGSLVARRPVAVTMWRHPGGLQPDTTVTYGLTRSR